MLILAASDQAEAVPPFETNLVSDSSSPGQQQQSTSHSFSLRDLGTSFLPPDYILASLNRDVAGLWWGGGHLPGRN